MVANVLVSVVLATALGISPAFMPIQPISVAIFTFIGVLGAVVAFAIVARVSRRPARTFVWVAAIALVLSLIPNVGLALNPAGAPFVGITPTAMAALSVLHVIAAAVSVGLLLRLMRA